MSSASDSMEPWSFRAPRHAELGAPHSPPGRDDFFDMQFEENYKIESTVVESVVVKQEVISPPAQSKYQETTLITKVKKEFITPMPRGHRRRSMSVHVMENNHSKSNHNNMYESAVKRNKNSSPSSLKSEKIGCQQSKYSGKASSVSSLQSNSHMNAKYIPMAEAIYHSQHDTPERFHSYSRNHVFPFQQRVHLKVTVPQSPALSSKTRNRPVHVLSQKEIEDLELEEIRKHKFKALPVSSAALCGYSNLPPVQRRPKTRPDPFNLTEMKKKIFEKPEEKFVFTARPIPKHILNKPLDMVKKNIPPTIPISPNITKTVKQRSRSLEHIALQVPKQPKCPSQMARKFFMGSVGHNGVPLSGKTTAHPCKPVPFSFEMRDKQREMMKNQKINKVLEEEKKLREFRANPIPVSILKKTKSIDKNLSPKHRQSVEIKKENKENYANGVLFKARPPLVLHKEPFVPSRSNRPQTEPCLIELTTDKRARERDAFNQKIKDKEEYLLNMRKIKEEEQKEVDEREIAELRTKLVHKAVPIKHYAPITIESSNKQLTLPKSPNFASKH